MFYLLLAIFFLLLLFYIAYWYLSVPKNLPPGPLGLPLLGSALSYVHGASQERILRENVKKYGPLFKLCILDNLIVVLGDYDTIQEALVKQGDAFAGRPQINFIIPKRFQNRGIIATEGALWKEHRRFALSTLRDFGVGRPVMEPRIKEEAEHLCEQISAYSSTGEPFDPNRLITLAVSNIICQLVLGHRFSYDDQVLSKHFLALTNRVSAAGATMLTPFVLSEAIAKFCMLTVPMVRTMAKETNDFIDFVAGETNQVIEAFDESEEPGNYIHAYMKAYSQSKDEAKSDDQLLAVVIDLFIAGSETTTTTLRWALLFLAHNPRVQEKLYEELTKNNLQYPNVSPDYSDRAQLPYTEAVIMEIQRLSNLVTLGVARRTLAPTTLRGYHIPEGTIVVPFLGNVLQSPELFPQPMHFDPDRFIDAQGKFQRDPKVIPFQAGKRVCPGEGLARMELFIFVTALASRFRFFFPQNVPTPPLDPVIGFTSTPRPYEICVEARSFD